MRKYLQLLALASFIAISFNVHAHTDKFSAPASEDRSEPVEWPQSGYQRIRSTHKIDNVMQTAIRKKQIPGGVVLIMHRGSIIYHKAFGNLMVKPNHIKTQKNSVYDLASLTKLFTATLIMRLHEEGIIDVTKPVATYLKSFAIPDKNNITIEQLLTHRSGLPAGIPVEDFTAGQSAAVDKIAATPLKYHPGTNFLYSDLGPIVAGYLAEHVTSKPLASLFKEYIFTPLDLQQTAVHPSPRFLNHIAACDFENGTLVHGRVHDPRAHALGDCAGNAGIFATAADVAKFGQLFLNGGKYKGKQLLSATSIRAMTAPDKSLPEDEQRGIGFDINTKYSLPRGKLFAKNSFGHTGFTGTSLWIDPTTQTIVVLLTNRLHPDGKGDVKKLRSSIGTLAAQLVQKEIS